MTTDKTPPRALPPIPPNLAEQRECKISKGLNSASGVLHLGAHEGQERDKYRALDLPVLWVEANPSTFEALLSNIKSYKNQRALCALLADTDGRQEEFHISNNHRGVSSSMFHFGQFGEGDRSLWPDQNLTMLNHITLTTSQLDSVLSDNAIDAANYDFWVLDLQGAELLALKGASQSVKTCKAILAEASTVEVYKGGVLWEELSQALSQLGFSPLWRPCREHDDILFVRNNAP